MIKAKLGNPKNIEIRKKLLHPNFSAKNPAGLERKLLESEAKDANNEY